MFSRNVGPVDRVIRIVVGLALLAAYVFSSGTGWALVLLVGVVPLVTGVLGTCGVYSLLGVSTCPARRS